MKYLHLIMLACACAMGSCQKDFDELEDSVQRRISFRIDPSHLFDRVLVAHGGSYAFDAPAMLDAGYQVRLTAYCYDPQELLVQSQTTVSSSLQPADVTFRHLDKDVAYRFVFVADVVKSDPYVDYYEQWFQLDTRQWSTFYLFSDSRSERPQHDVLLTATLTAQPQNQEQSVALEHITYNGYLVLEHANATDRLTGYAGYVNAFVLKTRTWKTRTGLAYDFAYHNPTQSSIVLPVNLCLADSVLNMKVKATSLSGTDSVVAVIPNSERRPFVATIDCESVTLKECKFY